MSQNSISRRVQQETCWKKNVLWCICVPKTTKQTKPNNASSRKDGNKVKTYHYTIADRLVKILIAGHIKVMEKESQIDPFEIRLCWLTINPEWDKTAFYCYPNDVLDNAGRIRITLDGRFDTVDKFRKYIHPIKTLEESAKSVGVDPNDWRISDKIVPISRFSKIEFWLEHDKKWVEIPGILNKKGEVS